MDIRIEKTDRAIEKAFLELRSKMPLEKIKIKDLCALACVHRTAEEMRTELYAVVDQGGTVVDVAVENPLYGELRGNLNLSSRYDVDNFIQQAADTPECLLSRMTGGVHLHTLCCPDEKTFHRIEAALENAGVLY